MIYLILAVAAQIVVGAAYTCTGDECTAVPEGLAGIYLVLALLVLSLAFNLLLTWRERPLRRVWVVGCLSSSVTFLIYGMKADLFGAGADRATWFYLGIVGAIGTFPLWSLSWLGLLAGEVLRRARGKGSGLPTGLA